MQVPRSGKRMSSGKTGRLVLLSNVCPVLICARVLHPSDRGRLKPFGCQIAAVRRSAWGTAADAEREALLDEAGAWGDLPRLAAAADIVVLACVQVRRLKHCSAFRERVSGRVGACAMWRAWQAREALLAHWAYNRHGGWVLGRRRRCLAGVCSGVSGGVGRHGSLATARLVPPSLSPRRAET